jgi:hypothetical protein
MNNHKVSAQFLFPWQRKTQKCEQPDFEKMKNQLEIAPAPVRVDGRKWYGHSSKEQVTANV